MAKTIRTAARWVGRSSPSSSRRALVLLLPLWIGCALAACTSGVRVRADAARQDLAEYESFAFLESSVPEELALRIEASVEKELTKIGLTRAPYDEAGLLVGYDTVVEQEERYIDPFERAFYSHERFELGTLVLEMLDASDDEVVWSGAAQGQLRITARGSGVSSIHYEPTTEEPNWRIEEKVERLLRRFPRA